MRTQTAFRVAILSSILWSSQAGAQGDEQLTLDAAVTARCGITGNCEVLASKS